MIGNILKTENVVQLYPFNKKLSPALVGVAH